MSISKLEITHRAGIEIDICPHCRGIWLDRGDLDRLAAPTPPSPAAVSTGRAIGDRTDRVDDEYDDYDGQVDAHRRPQKRSRKRRLADRLGDALEDVLDL